MLRIACALLFVTTFGCAEGAKPSPLKRVADTTPKPVPSAAPVKKSLYNRLGGKAAISKVVDDFVANVVADDEIKEVHKKHFREGDVAGLKRKLIDQIGEATGGPEKYTGKNMKDAHAGLKITDGDFDALAEDLVKALDQNKVGTAEKEELTKMLASMRPDVVSSQ